MDGDEDEDSETQVLESHSASLLRRAEQREWRYLFLNRGNGNKGSDKAFFFFFVFFQESTLRGQIKKMGSKTTEKLNCKDFTLRCANCVSLRIIFLLYYFEKNTRDNADTEHL